MQKDRKAGRRLWYMPMLVWPLIYGVFFQPVHGLTFSAPSLSQSDRPASDSRTRVAELLKEGARADAEGNSVEALSNYEAAAHLAPSDAQIYFRIGLLRGKAGDFENAKRALSHALEVKPNFPEAHYNLGLAIIGQAKQVPAWKEALREFDAALALRPDYPEALNLSGVCLLESGDAAEAEKRFRAALQNKADAATVHFNLGRALEANGNTDKALDEYLVAGKAKDPYPEAELKIGSLLLMRKDYQASAEHFQKALAANPDLQEAHYKLAQALRRLGRTDEAQIELRQSAALTRMQSDVIMSSHLSNESLDRAKMGDIAGALQVAKRALWLDPTNAIANYNLGLLLADAGNLEASILELRKAISLAPVKPAFCASLAKVEEKARHPRAAQAAIQRALGLSPGDAALRKRNVEISNLQPTAESARQTGETVLEFPFGAANDSADGHLAFASQLSNEGDFLGSVGELLRAVAMRPERNDIRISLAVARARLGQVELAELDFRKALLQSPADVTARVALGSLLLSAKQYTAAATEFRRVLELRPDSAEAGRLLAMCSAAQNQ